MISFDISIVDILVSRYVCLDVFICIQCRCPEVRGDSSPEQQVLLTTEPLEICSTTYFYMCMNACLHACLALYVCLVPMEESNGSPNLKLQMVVNYDVSAGSQTWVPCEDSKYY